MRNCTLLIFSILIWFGIILLPISNIQAENLPPTLILKNLNNNELVQGVINIEIIIYDYDQDGISDDIDIDVDNDTRLDLDKDGYEEGWYYNPLWSTKNENETTSDKDHDNDGKDFENDPDDDNDNYARNVDPDDTNVSIPWFYRKTPALPSNITIEIKIDNNSYEKISTITRDNYNGTWIIIYKWDTTKLSNGNHTITIHSKLNMNCSNEKSVIVIVKNVCLNPENNKFALSTEIIILLLGIIIISIELVIIYIKYRK